MRKGDRVELAISALDADGAGVAEHQGARVHVAGALPDERVVAEIAHVSPHKPQAWGALRTVTAASPDRVMPACRAYGECGGCVLGHCAYDAQLAFKTARVRELMPSARACIPSPRPLGYRNKSKLVYARGVLGAYAPRSHRVVDLSGCAVAESPLDEVARELIPLLAETPPYDERLGEGLLRYVILRVNHGGQVLAVFVTSQREWPQAPRSFPPAITGAVQNVNASRGNALFGRELHPLYGQPFLVERVGDVQLHLSAGAFFQVNRDVAARIYADVRAALALQSHEHVVDAYCGIGGIALTLAPDGAEVIGIEEHPGAIEDARKSGSGARFVCGRVEDELAKIGRTDAVVLNPPRSGCTPAVLQAAVELRPRAIAYVSCSPDTLARDLAMIPGYQVSFIQPYDMLPQTPHVECLALLTRA